VVGLRVLERKIGCQSLVFLATGGVPFVLRRDENGPEP
jgi:hypothetical protein